MKPGSGGACCHSRARQNGDLQGGVAQLVDMDRRVGSTGWVVDKHQVDATTSPNGTAHYTSDAAEAVDADVHGAGGGSALGRQVETPQIKDG